MEGVDYLDGYNSIRAFALLNGQLLDFDAVEKAFRNLLRCSNYFPCLHAGRVNGMRFSIDADGNVVVTDGTDDDTTYTLTPLDATLLALAATAWAANAIPIGTGTDTLSQVAFAANRFPARASTGNLEAKTITDFALTILDDADAATVRTTIGAGTGSGDVVGPAGATDNAIPLYNGTTGKLIKNSALTSDGNTLSVPGVLTTGAGRVKEIVEFDGSSITLSATSEVVVVSTSATIVVPNPANFVKYSWEVINVSGGSLTIDRNGFNINGAAADVSLPNGDRAHIDWDPRGGGWLVTGSAKLS